MSEISKEVQDAIKFAIELELNGRQFYKKAEELTRNERGKQMFERLAKDEVEHLETFSRLFTEALGGADWKQHVRQEALKGDSSLIERLEAKHAEDVGKGELEAIRIGMELERKALEHFSGAAKSATDPAAKAIFEKVHREEQLHYDLLQAQFDSVTNSGFWFDTAEFYMDGKF